MNIESLQREMRFELAKGETRAQQSRPVPSGAGQPDQSAARVVRLTGLINWQSFADEWGSQFVLTTGRSALPTRLMAALLYQ